jgi:RNA polymerase sigma-70 factor (ECF subfamily)
LFNLIEEKLDHGDTPKASDSEGGSVKKWQTEIEFRHLYDSAFPVLYRVAFRITNNAEAAEDLCQESFSRLHEKKMVFPNNDEAKYWLIRVVKNATLNYAKRKEREQKKKKKAFRENTRKEENGEILLVKKETRTEVQQALAKLPESMRMALILKEYGDMNYKEIGKVLGISEGNVKVRVFRARERLVKLLEGGVYVS